MNRHGFLIGLLAGGWVATLLVLALAWGGGVFSGELVRDARAEDLPSSSPGAPPIGPTVNDPASRGFRGGSGFGLGTSDSNHRAVALSASIGSGQSVVYYFDTVAERLCVYQYEPGNRGGIRLLAARHIGFDLKLEKYRDLSEKSPSEMREAYDKAMGDRGQAGGRLPTKRVDLPGGMR